MGKLAILSMVFGILRERLSSCWGKVYVYSICGLWRIFSDFSELLMVDLRNECLSNEWFVIDDGWPINGNDAWCIDFEVSIDGLLLLNYWSRPQWRVVVDDTPRKPSRWKIEAISGLGQTFITTIIMSATLVVHVGVFQIVVIRIASPLSIIKIHPT